MSNLGHSSQHCEIILNHYKSKQISNKETEERHKDKAP